MKKLLIFSIAFVSLVSCGERTKYVPPNPNLIYDTLSVSKLVDSIIQQTPNLNGNEANKKDAIHKIMYNNFYTIYNNVPLNFKGTSDSGIKVASENNKLYYGVYFSNEFETKKGYELSIDVSVIMEEKDVKTLMKDSLYVLTGDFSKFQNDEYRGGILDSTTTYSNYKIMFPMVWLKNHGKTAVPFTFKKITKNK